MQLPERRRRSGQPGGNPHSDPEYAKHGRVPDNVRSIDEDNHNLFNEADNHMMPALSLDVSRDHFDPGNCPPLGTGEVTDATIAVLP